MVSGFRLFSTQLFVMFLMCQSGDVNEIVFYLLLVAVFYFSLILLQLFNQRKGFTTFPKNYKNCNQIELYLVFHQVLFHFF